MESALPLWPFQWLINPRFVAHQIDLSVVKSAIVDLYAPYYKNAEKYFRKSEKSYFVTLIVWNAAVECEVKQSSVSSSVCGNVLASAWYTQHCQIFLLF